MLSYFLSGGVLVSAYTLFGMHIILAVENAVVTRLGKPHKVVTSGLTPTLYLIDEVFRFTQNIVELNFSLPLGAADPRRAGIICAKKKVDGVLHEQAVIGAEVSLLFNWPGIESNLDINEQPLVKALRAIGNPADIAKLTDLFEEPIFDAVRSAGGKESWREIAMNRRVFAKAVLGELNAGDPSQGDPISPIKSACMKNVQLIITHIDLPEDLKNALTQPEIARLQYEAGLATAELDKVKLKKAGEGHAYARKKLIEAIGENITIQSLLTMEEMAKGTSNTLIVLPTDIVAAFENIAKKGIDIAALFEGLNLDTETIKKISSALRKKGIVN